MLIELLDRYANANTDQGTDKNVTHCYGRLYDKLFSPIRTEVKNLLEIGISGGYSCIVWAMFFENAMVDGIDLTLSCVASGLEHPRVRYHVADATSEDTPCKLGRVSYDVIIDDGSHIPDHQIKGFRILVQQLRAGGLYIVEDIQNADVKPSFVSLAKEYGLNMAWYDMRKIKGRYDDIVAVFRKPKIDAHIVDLDSPDANGV